jgi:hypothetical protein
MAGTTQHQGLASPFGHKVHPCGLLGSARPVELGELADVVHLKALLRVADLAASNQEPVQQLVASGAGHDRREVRQDGRALAPDRDAAEAGDQWLPSSGALDGDLQARVRPVRAERSFGTPRAGLGHERPCIQPQGVAGPAPLLHLHVPGQRPGPADAKLEAARRAGERGPPGSS